MRKKLSEWRAGASSLDYLKVLDETTSAIGKQRLNLGVQKIHHDGQLRELSKPHFTLQCIATDTEPPGPVRMLEHVT